MKIRMRSLSSMILMSFALSSVAGAMLRPAQMGDASRARTMMQASMSDLVARQIVIGPMLLMGTTNRENILGSMNFSLPLKRQNAELRATLQPNTVGRDLPYGVSSNPEAYHLDVSYLTSGGKTPAQPLHLRYLRSRPSVIDTRVLIYEAPVMTTMGRGRIIATVQQIADTQQRVWKTKAAQLHFESN